MTIQNQREKSLKKVFDDTSVTDYETDKFFKNEWIDFIRQNMLQSRFDTKWLETNDWKKWLIIKPNIEDPLKTTFHCRICTENYDKLGFRWQTKPSLAKEEGFVLGVNKGKNREKFQEHVDGRTQKEKGRKEAVETDV